MSVGGGRKYGVQVGNETYSLILTPEDWEKRRQDRENAKKLSLANNKRRKALDDRKRVAEARENRKRELELYKRRQRQIEATERYQRFHVGNKDKRVPGTEQVINPPNLEDVLQKLRGGYGDGIAKTSTTTNPSSSEQLTAVADRVENIATTSQVRHPGLERTQWQNMKEYAEDVRRQILSTQHHDISSKTHKDQDDNLPDDNDGQDSLHGSSISTSSQPSYSAPNVITQQSIADITKDAKGKKVSFQLNPPTAWKETTVNNYSYQANRQTVHNPTPLQAQQNQIPLSGSPDSGILCKRDSQTGRITYYVKAYRPWSASVSNKSFQNTFSQSTNSSLPLRPSSSFEMSRKTGAQPESIPKFKLRHQDSWLQTSNQSHTSQNSVADTRPVENIAKNNQLNQQKEEEQTATTNQSAAEHITPSQGYRISSAPIRTTTATRVTSYFDSSTRKTSFSDHNHASLSTTVTFPSESEIVNSATSEISVKRPSSVTTVSTRALILPSEENSFFVETNEKTEDKFVQKKELKGILRQRSKYEGSPLTSYGLSRHPSYQSAGLARQKWLHGITSGEDNTEKEPRVRSADAKSVRWHQVQYNDGTSSMLDFHEGFTPKPPPQSAPPIIKPQITPKPSPRGKAIRKPAAARPKSSPARGMKGAKVKGGRRLRPAKENQINIVPHPPPQNHTPQLSMSTVINYSIDPSENTVPVKEFKAPRITSSIKRGTSPNGNKRVSLMSRNKIVFPRKGKSEIANNEAVTMSTLKSRGNDTRTSDAGEDGIISSHGNQVTIKVSSTKPIISVPSSTRRSSSDGRIPLNGTPTDQEIEMLWDKVRAYLAWSRNRGNSPLPAKKTRSTSERKIAWSTQTEPTKQISANIISIDGGIFSKQTNPEESSVQNLYKTQQIPVQYDRYGFGKSRKMAYSPTPSQEYGFISNHGSQTQLKEKVRGTIPTMRMKHPSSAPVRRTSQMTESVKTFRLVEALIEQNVPEEQILNALNSLQSTTREV